MYGKINEEIFNEAYVGKLCRTVHNASTNQLVLEYSKQTKKNYWYCFEFFCFPVSSHRTNHWVNYKFLFKDAIIDFVVYDNSSIANTTNNFFTFYIEIIP